MVVLSGTWRSHQDWRRILEKIDRNKYQPWFYNIRPASTWINRPTHWLANWSKLKQTLTASNISDVLANSWAAWWSAAHYKRAAILAKNKFVALTSSPSQRRGTARSSGRGVSTCINPMLPGRTLGCRVSPYLKRFYQTSPCGDAIWFDF